MADQKQPDRLAVESSMAVAAGMSYGKWKDMQDPAKKVPLPIPDGWRACEYCGKPFKRVQAKRFCDVFCQRKSYKKRRGM